MGRGFDIDAMLQRANLAPEVLGRLGVGNAPTPRIVAAGESATIATGVELEYRRRQLDDGRIRWFLFARWGKLSAELSIEPVGEESAEEAWARAFEDVGLEVDLGD